MFVKNAFLWTSEYEACLNHLFGLLLVLLHSVGQVTDRLDGHLTRLVGLIMDVGRLVFDHLTQLFER